MSAKIIELLAGESCETLEKWFGEICEVYSRKFTSEQLSKLEIVLKQTKENLKIAEQTEDNLNYYQDLQDEDSFLVFVPKDDFEYVDKLPGKRVPCKMYYKLESKTYVCRDNESEISDDSEPEDDKDNYFITDHHKIKSYVSFSECLDFHSGGVVGKDYNGDHDGMIRVNQYCLDGMLIINNEELELEDSWVFDDEPIIFDDWETVKNILDKQKVNVLCVLKKDDQYFVTAEQKECGKGTTYYVTNRCYIRSSEKDVFICSHYDSSGRFYQFDFDLENKILYSVSDDFVLVGPYIENKWMKKAPKY